MDMNGVFLFGPFIFYCFYLFDKFHSLPTLGACEIKCDAVSMVYLEARTQLWRWLRFVGGHRVQQVLLAAGQTKSYNRQLLSTENHTNSLNMFKTLYGSWIGDGHFVHKKLRFENPIH